MRARVESGPDKFAIHFDAIDFKAGNARMIGNQGAVDVLAAEGEAGITFIERTPVGNFNMTTVFPWHGAEGDFAAVTSRHVSLAGFYEAPAVSQRYGVCKIFQ